MLNRVLHEISQTKESIPLTALGQKLGIEQGALEGMLMYWVCKGRLKVDDDQVEKMGEKDCSMGGSCSACSGAATCPFIARVPKTYSLSVVERHNDQAR